MNLHDKDLLSTLLMHVWHIDDAKSEAGCEGRRGLNLRAFATSDPSRRTCVVVFGLLLFVYYLDVNTLFSFYLAAVFIFLFFSFLAVIFCFHFVFHFQFFKDEIAQEAHFHLQRLLLPLSPFYSCGRSRPLATSQQGWRGGVLDGDERRGGDDGWPYGCSCYWGAARPVHVIEQVFQ